ncbi:Peptide/nickel transport system ATP-binding protein [Ignavibacterium album JCM 16511]|uniref:Peptide/nickel transport system ATP-binding protein n=1 Tax=Ignavibacterium album (strain DSM 19864 / JCM 16511 / NBRC 101810 / Mat9-16) TaxID=945713 RepID=I0AGI6_IGNAJ|nr:ATP-binding cassette domain-containing protein [Ignavibacterium album]AFH48093.1 Peptide/nickel transport system ATP-binding protein [Ignavibacterium album JCM 16511]
MKEVLIKCENLTYEVVGKNLLKNEHKKILEDISLDISDKEIFSIAGESGSGKTTLAKILAGIILPTKGEIKYSFSNNFHSNKISAVQILFQNNGELINPYRTVESILKEAIEISGSNALFDSVDKLLDTFSLDYSIKKQKGYSLSGGQQQRVALARILAVNPQMIILDEPFSAQDKDSVENLVSLIKDINKNFGKTIVCISHDIKTIKNISNRLLILKNGKIVEIGSTEEIFSKPKSEYTKFLIKASQLELSSEEVKKFLKEYEQDQRNKNS